MAENIVTKILSLLENPPEISYQAIYIQYVFDLKYLTTLLIPLENDVSRTNIQSQLSIFYLSP